jgi:hypothetical protein
MLSRATAWIRPSSVRGTSDPNATARNGVRAQSGQAISSACNARFSHPSTVAFIPGVPDSIKSCASKCDREGSGDPEACTIAKCFWSHNGFSGAIAGCSPKNPSRSMTAFCGIPIFGRY